MPGRIRIMKHEAVPGCGSFEGGGSVLMCTQINEPPCKRI